MINLIAAVGKHGQIGLKGSLPWRDKEDLKWFKSLTIGNIVVVGGATYKTLPVLPDRLVVSMDYQTPQEIIKRFGNDLWIAGGAKTYKQWIPLIQRFYISRIDYDGDADAYFPTLNFEA